MTRRRPEVLAPAGEAACLEAAVAGGADAVYLGLRHFNARGRAANFRLDELPRQVAYLHHHGLRCYVVLNTLLLDDEFAKALRLARSAHAAGVDAVIVQDLGLWRVLGQELPNLERHASTQMTVHSPEQVRALAALGAKRIIVARELSLERLQACCVAAADCGVEIEHFVHGALCYAYSGQCLMSNFAGCRSANRGTCAQNCRFDYEQGGTTDTVLSMRDLKLLDDVPRLADAGVVSLKIEGRLKTPDYVYETSRAYRAATEAWLAKQRLDPAVGAGLRTVFSRGFTNGWLHGERSAATRLTRTAVDAQDIDAQLIALDRREGTALIAAPLSPQPGQGYRWQDGDWRDGFLVTGVRPAGEGRWQCRIRVQSKGPRPPAGVALTCNTDQAQTQAAQAAMQAVSAQRFRGGGLRVDALLTLRMGAVPSLRLSAADGRQVEQAGEQPVGAASGQPLSEEAIAGAIGLLAGGGFQLGSLQCERDVQAFVPLSQLKQLRRAALAALAALPAPAVAAEAAPEREEPQAQSRSARRTQLAVAVSTPEAAAGALAAGADRVILDDPRLNFWGKTLPDLSAWHAVAGEKLWLRLPTVASIPQPLQQLELPVWSGQLGLAGLGHPWVVDHPGNICNSHTALALAEQGAQGVCLSLECSARDLARLASALGDRGPELWWTVHGQVPAMLTTADHGLRPGQDLAIQAIARDGGTPYRLQAHAAGHTVVWEARELCAPQAVAPTAGVVDGWLLELAHLPASAVGLLTAAYARLRQDASAAEDISALVDNPHGCFPGHLAIGSRALDGMLSIHER